MPSATSNILPVALGVATPKIVRVKTEFLATEHASDMLGLTVALRLQLPVELLRRMYTVLSSSLTTMVSKLPTVETEDADTLTTVVSVLESRKPAGNATFTYPPGGHSL
jgi:hypothetical protein